PHRAQARHRRPRRDGHGRAARRRHLLARPRRRATSPGARPGRCRDAPARCASAATPASRRTVWRVTDAGSPEAPAPVPLLEPREGVPQPVTTGPELSAAVRAFAAGSGPVAVDAERASGYRYGQRAYLVQLRRAG